jgi:UDPglucose 6-dehydrogenase
MVNPIQRLIVIGTGYLGATHAVCMAELGFNVLGMDIDSAKIAALSTGEAPFYEPGLNPLLRKHLEPGRLRFTTSYAEAEDFGEVHFVCVGTPHVATATRPTCRTWRPHSPNSPNTWHHGV